MDCLTCKNCNQMLYVALGAQSICCFKCRALIIVRNTDDMAHHSRMPPSPLHIHCFGGDIDFLVDDEVNYKGKKEGSLEVTKKTAEAKLVCHRLRKKLPIINALQSQAGIPPLTISTTDQQRRGRRAFLCGVSYKKQKHELKGTAQDVKNMRDFLVQNYDFPTHSILILAEEEPYKLPTRKNIEEGFQWLIRGIQPGDSLVFYFSGHGMQLRDSLSDERDGFDEAICPVDFAKNGMILDNDINEAIVRPLIQGVTLHAFIDSCHSGTVLDLSHVYNITTSKWEDNSPPSGAYKGTNGGTAICFSACQDYQLTADTSAFSKGKEMTGAMTFTFILAVRAGIGKEENLTYQDIMDSMLQIIKEANKSGGLFTGIRRIFRPRILKDPVLSSSEVFNTSTVFKL